MHRRGKAWWFSALAVLLVTTAASRADDAACADGGCDRGRPIDHFPYVWYLRMHWGHREVPEQYASECYHITPGYRTFKPYCWYVNPAELYPSGPPPKEMNISPAPTAPAQPPAELPPPRPQK